MSYDHRLLCERVSLSLHRNPNSSLTELSRELHLSRTTLQSAVIEVTGKKFKALRDELFLAKVNNLLVSRSNATITTCPDVGQPVLASSPSTPFSDKLATCSRCCLPGGQNCTTTTAPTQAILANGNVVRSEIITWTCTSISLNP